MERVRIHLFLLSGADHLSRPAARYRGDGQTSILFVGDSFTPSGMDDYCLLNRNFFAPEKGFLDCLRDMRKINGDYLLINEHVAPAFRFSPAQIDLMTETFLRAADLMAALFPWDDPNYGVDEQWARFYPYTAEVAAGGRGVEGDGAQPLRERAGVSCDAARARRLECPAGPLRVTFAPRQERAVSFPSEPRGAAGLGIVTADVAFGAWELREWAEAMVTAK